MTHQPETQKRIYLDNSASTPVDSRVVAAMHPFWSEYIGNAGSIHSEGRFAKDTLEQARSVVARLIHTKDSSIIFTSGGTESNNLAILGTIEKCLLDGRKAENVHIITSAVEHNSVLDCGRILERKGVRVTYLPVDTSGRVVKAELESALTKDTVLVSLIYVNNEIGTIEHIAELSDVLKKFRRENTSSTYPLLHTDASQAFAWVPIDVQKLGVDLVTLDSQKMYGPKGAGCLFVREREMLEPLMYGGGQEFGLRPGTPPIPLIVGFTKALELVEEERETYVKEISRLRDWLLDEVRQHIPEVVLNGDNGEGRTAGNLSLSFPEIDYEQLVIELDVKGIAVSTKSACLSQGSGGSHVIQALHNGSDGAMRISLSRFTTQEEIDQCARVLVETVRWLQPKH